MIPLLIIDYAGSRCGNRWQKDWTQYFPDTCALLVSDSPHFYGGTFSVDEELRLLRASITESKMCLIYVHESWLDEENAQKGTFLCKSLPDGLRMIKAVLCYVFVRTGGINPEKAKSISQMFFAATDVRWVCSRLDFAAAGGDDAVRHKQLFEQKFFKPAESAAKAGKLELALFVDMFAALENLVRPLAVSNQIVSRATADADVGTGIETRLTALNHADAAFQRLLAIRYIRLSLQRLLGDVIAQPNYDHRQTAGHVAATIVKLNDLCLADSSLGASLQGNVVVLAQSSPASPMVIETLEAMIKSLREPEAGFEKDAFVR